MAQELLTPIVFTDADHGGITAKKLNLSWQDATITPAFITDKTAVGGYASGDYLLLYQAASGNLVKIPPSAVSSGGGTGSGDMLKSVYDTNNNGVVDTADAIGWAAVTGKPATFPPDATAELLAHKGAVNGYPSLDATGKVPSSQLPAFGTGDMLKSTYDTNANGVVDTCDALAWSKVTGTPASYPSDWNTTANKPSTFPPDSTAMLKATYDTNANGVVDTCDSLAWGKLTGVPATFPPDSTAMLKSVYDTNADNIVDHAALADTAPWGGISGKPATFPPDATAELLAHKGAVNGYPSLDATGKVPISQLPAFGTGDMTKAVYDTNANGVVDTCDSLAWSKLTGVPATFPPDSTAMLKTVYDTNANGVVDTCDSLAYSKLTGTPSIPTVGTLTTQESITGGGSMTGNLTINLVGDIVTPTNGQFYGYSGGARGWFTPSGAGDMTKAVYDTNGNNVVDTCDSLAWSKLTGLPTGNMVDPGTWTALTYSTGWTQNTTAQFRVETNGTFQKVICQGIINYASGAAALAFTLPIGAQPSVARGCVLSGYDSTGDVMLFSANIATSGAVTIYPMVRQAFSWPSATNGSVYLDSLSFSL